MVRIVRDVYERYGFEPLETPAFENIDTLLGKYGEEGNKLIFKILRRGEHEASGEADLALRYDLTVPLARVVAQYQNELPKFFKRYQIQPVWRADRPARGRFREFYQCDIDAIGSTSPMVEVELCSAVTDTLRALGFRQFLVRISHRDVLSGILEAAGLPAGQHASAVVALDKLDKLGAKGVREELLRGGTSEHHADELLTLFALDSYDELRRSGTEHPELPFDQALLRKLNQDVFGHLAKFIGSRESGVRGLNNLSTILEFSQSTSFGDHIVLDVRLARGLTYYTGAIMEIAVPDLAGSLGGGGRYDNLIGMFLGKDVPACGFSLGLERIIVVMSERSMFPATVARGFVDVMVTIWSDETRGEALTLAAELRAAGLRADVYPESDKLGKQFSYASSRDVSFVAILGDDERARGEVAVKDLRSGEQTPIRRAEVAPFIRARLIPEHRREPREPREPHEP